MKKCPTCAEEIQDEAIKCRHCGKDLKEDPFKKTSSSLMKVGCGIVLLSICLIGLILIVVFFWAAFSSNEKSSQNKIQKQENIEAKTAPYEITASENWDAKAMTKNLSEYGLSEIDQLPISKRVQYRVVVSPQIQEDQIKSMIEEIIATARKKDSDVDAIRIFIYSDKSLSEGGFDVARAVWAPGEDFDRTVTPEIARTNDRSSYKTTIKILDKETAQSIRVGGAIEKGANSEVIAIITTPIMGCFQSKDWEMAASIGKASGYEALLKEGAKYIRAGKCVQIEENDELVIHDPGKLILARMNADNEPFEPFLEFTYKCKKVWIPREVYRISTISTRKINSDNCTPEKM